MLCVLGIILTLVQTIGFADPPLPTPVGRVVWVTGSLKALMPNQEERTLVKSSVIYLKDTLITDAKSQAQIVFTDNTLLTFTPQTRFVIDQYSYNPQAKSKSIGKYVMNLIEGGFRTITGLIAKKNPTDYQVNTPVATIGVRGTDYAVYVKGGQLSMAQYGGSPCIQNDKGSLCLNSTVTMGGVSIGGSVHPITTLPPAIQQKAEIKPAAIAPFTGGGGTQSAPQGPISSFCITN